MSPTWAITTLGITLSARQNGDQYGPVEQYPVDIISTWDNTTRMVTSMAQFNNIHTWDTRETAADHCGGLDENQINNNTQDISIPVFDNFCLYLILCSVYYE